MDTDLFSNVIPEFFIPLTRFIANYIDHKTHISNVEKVVVVPSEDEVSKCFWLPSPCGGDSVFHVIKIHIDNIDLDTRVLQWIQLFSHEYMHHAICRKERSSAPHPLVWFDEMLCQISSVCTASEIFSDLYFNRTEEIQWMRDKKANLSKVINFPAQMSQDSPLVKSIRSGKGIRGFLPFPEDGLNLALYSIAIASCVQNLFCKNPNLWKIVPLLNQVPLNSDIDTLFLYLKMTADESYKKTLDELINLLLPY